VYPASWALPLAILATLLVIAGAVRMRRHDTILGRSVLVGAGATIAALLIACVAAVLVAIGLASLHAALENGSPEWSNVYGAALTVLTLAISLLVYRVARRWASPGGLHVGAMFVWSALALAIAITVPGASHLFVWPLLFAAIATLSEPIPRVAMAARWFAALVTVFLFAPTVYLMVCVALGLAVPGAIIMAVLVTLTVWLLAPHVETLYDAGRPWLATGIAAATAACLFVAGMLTVRTSTRVPVGVIIQYLSEPDSSRAWLAADATSAGGRARLTGALRDFARDSASGALPDWLRTRFAPNRVVPGPFVRMSPASVTVLGDSAVGGERRLLLRVLPGETTYNMVLILSGATVTEATVDGRAIPNMTRAARWRLGFSAPPDSGFQLRLTMQATGTKPSLEIFSRVLRVPDLGRALPVLPQGFVPISTGTHSSVYRRIPL